MSNEAPVGINDLVGDVSTGMEKVQVVRCAGLSDEDPFGSNDPFVVVKDADSGAELFRTKVKEGAGSACEFDNAFVDLEQSQARRLRVEVWDKDISSDDLIGVATVPVPQGLDRSDNARLQLFKEEEPVKSGMVILRWFPKEPEPDPEPTEQPKLTRRGTLLPARKDSLGPTLKLTSVFASTETGDQPASELQHEDSMGWCSADGCEFPAELVFRFDGDSRVDFLRLMSHESKVSTKVEIFFAAATDEDRKNKRFPDHRDATFTRLGHVKFAKGDGAQQDVRELKTVGVNENAMYLKLLLHGPHQGASEQVSIMGVGVHGEVHTPLTPPPTASSPTPPAKPKDEPTPTKAQPTKQEKKAASPEPKKKEPLSKSNPKAKEKKKEPEAKVVESEPQEEHDDEDPDDGTANDFKGRRRKSEYSALGGPRSSKHGNRPPEDEYSRRRNQANATRLRIIMERMERCDELDEAINMRQEVVRYNRESIMAEKVVTQHKRTAKAHHRAFSNRQRMVEEQTDVLVELVKAQEKEEHRIATLRGTEPSPTRRTVMGPKLPPRNLEPIAKSPRYNQQPAYVPTKQTLPSPRARGCMIEGPPPPESSVDRNPAVVKHREQTSSAAKKALKQLRSPQHHPSSSYDES